MEKNLSVQLHSVCNSGKIIIRLNNFQPQMFKKELIRIYHYSFTYIITSKFTPQIKHTMPILYQVE